MKKGALLRPIVVLAFIGAGFLIFQKPNTVTIQEEIVAPISILETTGSVEVVSGQVKIEFPAQPTQLAGNYTDNGIMLRAWAEKNKQSMVVPEGAQSIIFKLAKTSKYENVPGNIQIAVDGKNICNGRLRMIGEQPVDGYYMYAIDNFTTQDKTAGIDLSQYIGKELTFKVWIGENKNYVESITINRQK